MRIVLRAAILDGFQINLGGGERFGRKRGKITENKFFSPPFPGCVKISTPVNSVHILNQDGHTYRAGERSILTILDILGKGDCEKCNSDLQETRHFCYRCSHFYNTGNKVKATIYSLRSPSYSLTVDTKG